MILLHGMEDKLNHRQRQQAGRSSSLSATNEAPRRRTPQRLLLLMGVLLTLLCSFRLMDRNVVGNSQELFTIQPKSGNGDLLALSTSAFAFGDPANGKEATQEDSPSSVIPRRLIFTYKHNILETKEPKHFYDNIRNTIQKYQDHWQMDVDALEVSFLTDTDCERILQTVAPQLVSHFAQERMGAYRADMCRLAALYQAGGYYFDIDVEVMEAYSVDTTAANNGATFLTAREASQRHLFQAILAATPGHAILTTALEETVPNYYQNRRYKMHHDTVWMGPYTLQQAYDKIANGNDTTPIENSILLQEVNLEDFPNDYPSVVRRRGDGCCCNYVVQDASAKAYFYSRMVGAGGHCNFPRDKLVHY